MSLNNVVQITLSSQLSIRKLSLPDQILGLVRAYLTMMNPKYQDALDHGYYTGNIPQEIRAYHEDEVNICAFRGYLGSLIPFLCQAGLKHNLIDNRRKLPDINFTFKGDLRQYQQKAVMATLQKHFGILVAPCGSGKTVMALSVVAVRRQPTLIICHTKELLTQWIERINQYLGISRDQVGVIGNGKAVIKPVTVGMVQTLCKRDLSEINKYFGQIIVDECHRTPSSTFTEVITAFDSFYMLGLSATPYRRDKLNKLIFLTLGNVSAQVKDAELRAEGLKIKPEIIVRETTFDYNYQEDSDYQPMISALAEDPARNRLIVNDVYTESQRNGNCCLVLSDRKEHCRTMARLLDGQGIKGAVLTADVPKKQREQIVRDFETGALRVIIATSQLAGEGLDLPRINRLFITLPIKWKGRLVQYIGRALRVAEGKTDTRIYDYVDRRVGVLMNSYRTRCYQVYDHLN